MGNPHRGEVEFKVGERTYVLHLSTNAMIELEEHLGAGVVQLATTMGDTNKFKVKDLRTMFWCGLRDRHEALTELEAGRLMDEIGILKTGQLVAEAFTLAFPQVDTSRPLPGEKIRASTGKRH